MKKISMFIFVVFSVLVFSACGKKGQSNISSVQILPHKIENVSTEPSIVKGCEADKHDDSKYPLEYLGGVWVIEGISNGMSEVSASEETMMIETKTGKVKVESMPVQLNLMPFKDNPFESCGVGYGELLYKKVDSDNFFEPFYAVPIVYDTHEDILALGKFNDKLLYEDGKVTDSEGKAVDNIKITEFQYRIKWTGWDLTLENGKQETNYVPSDIDSGKGVSFMPDAYEMYGGVWSSIGCKGLVALHEEYESIDNIIRVDPVDEVSGIGNIQFYLEKAVGAEYSFGDDGFVSIDTEDSGAYKYNFLYSGRSLVIVDGDKNALYSVYSDKSEEGNAYTISSNTRHFISISGLQFGEQSILINNDSLAFLLEQGAVTNENLEQLLAPGAMVDLAFSLNDEEFTVRIINIYDTHISYLDADVAGIYVDSKKGNIIFDSGYSSEDGLEYGVTTIQEVFDYWGDVPCEKTENSLTYKAPGRIKIQWGNLVAPLQGLTNKKVIIEDDSEREIKFLFEDGILCGFERIAPALVYSGLHDNIAGDELTELEPSYVGDVTVVRDTILDKLKVAFSAAGVSVNINENTGEVVMSNGILFGVDEHELSAEGKAYIDSFMNVYASVLLSDEFADVISGIAIEGHCDPTGTDAYNQVLSQKRADSVKAWCVESTTNKLTETQKTKLTELANAKGYSFSDPVFDERGEVNNEASRRVAIKFFIDIKAATNAAE